MKEYRLALLNDLDARSKKLAEQMTQNMAITPGIMSTINELYLSAKVEQLSMGDDFESAYHTAITGELEFFIARIFYHYSKLMDLGWKISLRRQKQSTVPDIRITRKDKTLSVIEIKAKGGWIQPFFSPERYLNDKTKNRNNHPFNPDDLIQRERNKLEKYAATFDLKKQDIYFLLPTLTLVHRRKYTSTLSDYFNYFESTAQLPKENFILLSENLRLDLAGKFNLALSQPTGHFERMINELKLKK